MNAFADFKKASGTKQPKTRFAFVDALRGVAALGVVLFHSLEGKHIPALEAAMPDWLRGALAQGNLGVAIFFVLSGFVISHSLFDQRVTLPLAARFMLRRSLRLDPPYYFAIAITLVFAILSRHFVPDKPFPDTSFTQLLAHIVYLQDILGYPALSPVFWTLCLEVQFYILYVAILAACGSNSNAFVRDRTTIVALGAALLVALLWPTANIQTSPWSGSFLPLWYGFLIGVFSYWSTRRRSVTPFFLLTSAILFVFGLWNNNPFALVCVATAMLLSLAAATNKLATGLSYAGVQFLGAISYSLYLIHNPITGASFRVGYMLTGHGLWWEGFWWVVSIAACIASAGIMWWFVERPSMRLARRVRLYAKPPDDIAVPILSERD
jgi:peptidoglycan/LPS O-acetylase OafA/YrhL